VCKIRELITTVREATGLFPVLIFGSAMHGAGRSFLSKRVMNAVSREGYPVERVGVGEIFRKIAAEEGISIDQFTKMQSEDPSRFYELNIKIDDEIYRKMHEIPEDRVAIIDSNLAAYYADTENAYAFLVYAPPKIIAKRVSGTRRFGDEAYRNEDAALKALLERTREDILAYRNMAKIARSNFWKMVYRIAADDMEKNLEAILAGKCPNSPFYHASIDNGGTEEETLAKWCETVDALVNRHV